MLVSDACMIIPNADGRWQKRGGGFRKILPARAIEVFGDVVLGGDRYRAGIALYTSDRDSFT